MVVVGQRQTSPLVKVAKASRAREGAEEASSMALPEDGGAVQGEVAQEALVDKQQRRGPLDIQHLATTRTDEPRPNDEDCTSVGGESQHQ